MVLQTHHKKIKVGAENTYSKNINQSNFERTVKLMVAQNKQLENNSILEVENMLDEIALLIQELLDRGIEDTNGRVFLEQFKDILDSSNGMSQDEFKQALIDLQTYKID